MKVVFMGTPGFASASLERLYSDGHEVAGVFTKPDKPRGRGMKVSFSPVKEIAMSHGTSVYQPDSLADGSAADIIRALGCDIIAVAAYGKILPKMVLDAPPLGCVNVHASLLPKYRGAAPIQWAILNGEPETGVTTIYMTAGIDDGDILMSSKLAISDDETAGELQDRLSATGAFLLSATLAAIANGTASRTPQNHSEASWAPILKKEMSSIDWDDTALNIKRKVRGLNPQPVATAELGGSVYKIFSVDIGDRRHAGKKPGEIISAGAQRLEIACADTSVIIKELQAPGGRRMPAEEYLRGHSIEVRSRK